MTNNYELRIISRDQSSEGKVLKKYTIDGQETVGVVEGEPFQIQFKNKTWNKVQVRISVDGTDIQTGSLASTSPEGTMWFCEPYGTLDLKAWPENSNGGSEFLFSKVEESVAANTHGNMSGKGIIAAAVFVEGYVAPIPAYGQGFAYGAQVNLPYMKGLSYNSANIGGIRGQSLGGNFSASTTRLSRSLRGSEGIVSMDAISEEKTSANLAVGAGDYVNQTIVKVAGLTQPKLDTTVSVKYEPWLSLRSKVRALQKVAINPSNPGFPGDAELKMIDLKGTPKGRKRPSRKPARTPDLQRF